MPRLALLTALALTGCENPGFRVPVEPGRYRVLVDVELLPRDEVVVANNYGIPPKGPRVILGRYYPAADPPLIRVVLPEHVNDRESMCVLGHEVLHDIYGKWHAR